MPSATPVPPRLLDPQAGAGGGGADGAGAALGRRQLDALAAYQALLQRWGGRFNLVSRRDLARLWPRHIEDSLALAPWCAGTVVDVGSGAGLPGVPLAIASPQLAVTLVERSERKCAFLRQVVLELALRNVVVEQVDARDYRPVAGFRTALARAVAPPPAAWRLLQPLLARDGTALLSSYSPPRTRFAGGRVVGAARAGCGWVTRVRRQAPVAAAAA